MNGRAKRFSLLSATGLVLASLTAAGPAAGSSRSGSWSGPGSGPGSASWSASWSGPRSGSWSGPRRADAPGAVRLAPPCHVSTPGTPGSFPSLLDASMPGGAVLLGGSYVTGAASVTVLSLESPGCRPVENFGEHGTVTVRLTVPRGSAGVTAVGGTPSGEVLLAGGYGKDILVGRLRADGSLDTSFGSKGWARYQPPGKPPSGMPLQPGVTSIVQGPRDLIYLGGNDGSPHCCVQDFVAALGTSGRLRSAFANHGWSYLSSLDGSYLAQLFPTTSGLIVMGFVMFTGCGGPVLTRLFWSGKVDKAFGPAAQQWVENAKPHYVMISPSLYFGPHGRFVIAGGLMPSSCQVHSPPNIQTGLATGFLSDGQRDSSYGVGGRASFPSTSSTDVLAVGRPDGSAYLISERDGSGAADGVLQALEVRELSAAGHLLSSSAGVQDIDLAWADRPGVYPAIAALAGPQGSAIIMVASEKRSVIYRVNG